MEPEVYDEMFALEERHWWFRARRRIVLDLLRRYVQHRDGHRPRLADLGCGCGANLATFAADYDAWGADAIAAAAAYAHITCLTPRSRGINSHLEPLTHTPPA